MSSRIRISCNNKNLDAHIKLEGSKSISNRVLAIQSLCKTTFNISNLSPSNDTSVLSKALSLKDYNVDLGDAGTSFRFITAILSLDQSEHIVKGSNRMHERPIAPLVDALNELGADITYLENNGYPPLLIKGIKSQKKNTIEINGDVSSQFISALLIIAPNLKNGLNLSLKGNIVSRPYIQLTLDIMSFFGIEYSWQNELITIKPQNYQPKHFVVESDWSAASYYYAIAAFSSNCKIYLEGLYKHSSQGDAIISSFGEKFGVKTVYTDNGIHLTKLNTPAVTTFENDFLSHPDLAQTISVICAGLGINGLFSGLQTLLIKETNRIKALQTELQKFGVSLH